MTSVVWLLEREVGWGRLEVYHNTSWSIAPASYHNHLVHDKLFLPLLPDEFSAPAYDVQKKIAEGRGWSSLLAVPAFTSYERVCAVGRVSWKLPVVSFIS